MLSQFIYGLYLSFIVNYFIFIFRRLCWWQVPSSAPVLFSLCWWVPSWLPSTSVIGPRSSTTSFLSSSSWSSVSFATPQHRYENKVIFCNFYPLLMFQEISLWQCFLKEAHFNSLMNRSIDHQVWCGTLLFVKFFFKKQFSDWFSGLFWYLIVLFVIIWLIFVISFLTSCSAYFLAFFFSFNID